MFELAAFAIASHLSVCEPPVIDDIHVVLNTGESVPLTSAVLDPVFSGPLIPGGELSDTLRVKNASASNTYDLELTVYGVRVSEEMARGDHSVDVSIQVDSGTPQVTPGPAEGEHIHQHVGELAPGSTRDITLTARIRHSDTPSRANQLGEAQYHLTLGVTDACAAAPSGTKSGTSPNAASEHTHSELSSLPRTGAPLIAISILAALLGACGATLTRIRQR